MRRTAPLVVAALVAALAVPAGTSAAPKYPEPSKPKGQTGKPKGKPRTLRVGKNQRYRTIQKAVNAARAGDVIRVADGTYRESVKITGARKRYLKLVGNRSNPERVMLDLSKAKGAKAQSGVVINGADHVTVDGFAAKGYRGNGFFAVNVTGYRLTNLVAQGTGTYGVYAFNSRGGEISDSEAYYHNDSGFYIGQTPPQTKPIRSVVRNVRAWGNVIGFSGTNMRYVTITRSKWFNNGVGIVPNALDTEKHAPPEDNVIRDNDIFWNNFNYFLKAPFKLRKSATGEVAYPVGTGVLLFGGRRAIVENNRIYGHYLFGFGAIEQILLKQKDAKDLIGNQVRGNAFGLNGTDRNGRDAFYDGNGSGNCFAGNTGMDTILPADGSTFAPCPHTGANAFNAAIQGEVVGWALEADREKHWVKHPHAPRSDGIVPLEHWEAGTSYGGT